jgi:hypothetical protein
MGSLRKNDGTLIDSRFCERQLRTSGASGSYHNLKQSNTLQSERLRIRGRNRCIVLHGLQRPPQVPVMDISCLYFSLSSSQQVVAPSLLRKLELLQLHIRGRRNSCLAKQAEPSGGAEVVVETVGLDKDCKSDLRLPSTQRGSRQRCGRHASRERCQLLSASVG